MPRDLRYALRLIRQTPAASAIAILTVAIGVGANAAIFSIIGDDQPGRDHVVVLSHRLWVSTFGGDRSKPRTSLRIDSAPFC